MTFFARSCATILPVTLALDAADPAKIFLSSVCTANTVPNFTCSPTSPFTRSMRMVSPGATRYCFPPVCITAYIIPPRAKDKPQLYAAFCTSVNQLPLLTVSDEGFRSGRRALELGSDADGPHDLIDSIDHHVRPVDDDEMAAILRDEPLAVFRESQHLRL